MDYCRSFFPSSFLVFISYAASKDFDGSSFWENLFDRIGIEPYNRQAEIKKLFYDNVVDRGFPCYRPEDRTFHYLYTALLHGGLSKSFWVSIWRDAVLPYAKNQDFERPLKGEGQRLLNWYRGDGYGGSRPTYVSRILEKTPLSILNPLLEEALGLARELAQKKKNSANADHVELICQGSLTEPAVQALVEVLEAERKERGEKTRSYFYFAEGEMRIDPYDGRVSLHWETQKMPADFDGAAVEYLVNGDLKYEQSVVCTTTGGRMLKSYNLQLSHGDQFDVEIRVAREGDGIIAGPFVQSLARTSRGLFEFWEGPDQVFRLKKPKDRMRKSTRIAYLVKDGFRVVPKSGMEDEGSYEAGEGWEDAVIQVFMVSPASSGSIVRADSGEEVACWRPDIETDVERPYRLGKTESGRDLFGYAESPFGTNRCLPEIRLSREGGLSTSEIEVLCVCDGRRVSLSRKNETEDTVVVLLGETPRIGKLVADCDVSVALKETEEVIFRYRFAVVPVGGFGIREIEWVQGRLWASYSFSAMSSVITPDPDDGEPYDMCEGDVYCFDEPLTSAAYALYFKIQEGACVNAVLELAALDVKVPNDMLESLSGRPISRLDAPYLDGQIVVRAQEKRRGRSLYAALGDSPIGFERMLGKRTFAFDVCGAVKTLSVKGEEAFKEATLHVCFGEEVINARLNPASAGVSVARGTTGFGLGKPRLVRRDLRKTKGKKGIPFVQFENKATTQFHAAFYKGRILLEEESSLEKGESLMRLPEAVARHLDAHRTIEAFLFPVSPFGGIDEAVFMSIELKR